MKFHEELIELMRSKSEDDFEYINPNFLLGITDLIREYYQVEDDEVDEWIQNMFGA